MRMTKRQAVAKAQGAIDNYQQQVGALQEERSGAEREAQAFGQDSGEAIRSLAASWVGSGSQAEVEAITQFLPQSNLGETVARCEQDLARNRGRIDEIARDEEFRQRAELLEKEFPILNSDQERRQQEIEDALEPYRCEEFEYALAEQLHVSPKVSGLKGVWESLTGKARRKRRTIESLRERFRGEMLNHLVEQYERLQGQSHAIQEEQSALAARRSSLENLVAEYHQKSEMIANFDAYRVAALTQDLAHALAQISPEAMVGVVPLRLKTEVARCHALQKKREYSENLLRYLDGEIADRKKRISSVKSAQGKWRRYPKGYVGDKTKWLETIPEMKRSGTAKRTRWSRQTRSCLCHYDDYYGYGNHMWHSHGHHRPFLAFDVFNFGAEHRMPYEGFSRQVVEELDQHREQFEQEGPPKEWLQEHSQPVEGGEAPIETPEDTAPPEMDADAMEEMFEEQEMEAFGDEPVSSPEEDLGLDEEAEDYGDEVAEAFAEEAKVDDGDVGDVS